MTPILLELRANNMYFKLNISGRINFIRGSSGSGKTTFVDLVRYSRVDTYTVQCNLSGDISSIVVLSDSDYQSMRFYKNALVIFDDPIFFEDEDFVGVVEKYVINNNLVLLLMTRADLVPDFKDVAIYVLKSELGEYWLERSCL